MFASCIAFDFSEVSIHNLIDVVVLRPSSSSCGGRNVTASRVMLVRSPARQLRFDLFDGRAWCTTALCASKHGWVEPVVLTDALSSGTGPARA
jgi:hypothetical protein